MANSIHRPDLNPPQVERKTTNGSGILGGRRGVLRFATLPLTAIALFAVGVAGSGAPTNVDAAVSFSPDAAAAGPAHPHQFLVHFNSRSRADHAEILQRLRAHVVTEIPQIGLTVAETAGAPDQAVAQLNARRDLVKFAETNGIGTLPDNRITRVNLHPKSAKPMSDPTNTINQCMNDSYLAASAQIGAPDWGRTNTQWDQVPTSALLPNNKTSGSKVKIAALDTGVDNTHPDLVGTITSDSEDLANPSDPNPFRDVSGHGTAIAGTMVAHCDGEGVAGYAGETSEVTEIKVFTDTTTPVTNDALIAQGITDATDKGAQVILIEAITGPSQSIQDAIDYANAHNAVVVGAIGNEGKQVPTSYPGHFKGIVTAGASDQNDHTSSFNTIPQKSPRDIDGFAPESSLTTSPGGAFASSTGTSNAAAEGAAILAFNLSQNPGITNTQNGLDVKAATDPMVSDPNYTLYPQYRNHLIRVNFLRLLNGGARKMLTSLFVKAA